VAVLIAVWLGYTHLGPCLEKMPDLRSMGKGTAPIIICVVLFHDKAYVLLFSFEFSVSVTLARPRWNIVLDVFLSQLLFGKMKLQKIPELLFGAP
jgi:hypothetical protein